VLLEIAGFYGNDGQGVERFLLPLVTKLAVGIGTAPDHAAHCARLITADRPNPEPGHQPITPGTSLNG
jgi:hypothetical protein